MAGASTALAGSSAARPRQSLLLAVILLLALSPAVSCLRFELSSGQTKCVSEDIKSGSMAVGKYSVVSGDRSGSGGLSGSSPLPDSQRVSIRVTSPHGNSMHYAERVEEGHFAFTAAEAGDYLACFWLGHSKPPESVTFEFDWRSGVATKDWTNVAKKGQVDMMELELKKLEDTVQTIHEEMYYLRSREEEMQELNRRTNSRMAWLSVLSIGICLSVAGMQLWHLKTFFERKKLL